MVDPTQGVVFVTADQRLAAGEDVCPHPELGREEGVQAEEQIVRDDQRALQQWAEGAEPREDEEEGVQGALVALEQDVVQGEGVVQAVRWWQGMTRFWLWRRSFWTWRWGGRRRW